MVDVNRIRIAADTRGVKLGKICELLGEASNFLGKVERGIRKMDDNQVRIVADFLGVNFYYLTGESDNMITGATELKKQQMVNPTSLYPMFRYKRFLKCCREENISESEIEKQLDLPEGFFRNSFINGADDFPEEFVRNLAAKLNTSGDYLLGISDDPAGDNEKVKIRAFGEVAAGFDIPLRSIDNFDPDDADTWAEINRRTAKNGEYFALRIKGDSMEPRMFEGDTVIVRHQPSVESGEIAIVAINGDEATCKKVTFTSDGMILNSLNPKYEPRFFTNERIQKLPVRILGKVVEIRGKP